MEFFECLKTVTKNNFSRKLISETKPVKMDKTIFKQHLFLIDKCSPKYKAGPSFSDICFIESLTGWMR